VKFEVPKVNVSLRSVIYNPLKAGFVFFLKLTALEGRSSTLGTSNFRHFKL
jgi:hypothetical protein